MKKNLKILSKNEYLYLKKPKLMGILNVTQNSFSDGGKFLKSKDAINHAKNLINSGVDWIDIGGESSGPNTKGISEEEEISRVIPVIEAIRKQNLDFYRYLEVKRCKSCYHCWG